MSRSCQQGEGRRGVGRAARIMFFHDRNDVGYRTQPACGRPAFTPACLAAWWRRVQRVKLEREFLELQNRAFNAPTQQLVELRQLQTEVRPAKACMQGVQGRRLPGCGASKYPSSGLRAPTQQLVEARQLRAEMESAKACMQGLEGHGDTRLLVPATCRRFKSCC